MTSGQVDGGIDAEVRAQLSLLTRWERRLCGALGLVIVGIGVVAVFESSSDVATGVLLGMGALFLVMGVTGRSVTSVKVGGAEFQLAELQKAVVEQMTTASPPVRAALAEAVLEASPTARTSVANKARWVLYEEALREELGRIAPRAEIRDGRSHTGDGPCDIVLVQDDKRVGIDVKFAAKPLKTDTVRAATSQANSGNFDSFVLVASQGFTPGARAEFGSMAAGHGVQLVAWRSPLDTPLLLEALRAAGIEGLEGVQ